MMERMEVSLPEMGRTNEEEVLWGEGEKFSPRYPKLELVVRHEVGDIKQTVGYKSTKSGNRCELEIRIWKSKANR